jgi:hypothetical protein
MRRDKTQTNTVRNTKWEITTCTKEIKGTLRDYFENLCSQKKILRKWTNFEVLMAIKNRTKRILTT